MGHCLRPMANALNVARLLFQTDLLLVLATFSNWPKEFQRKNSQAFSDNNTNTYKLRPSRGLCSATSRNPAAALSRLLTHTLALNTTMPEVSAKAWSGENLENTLHLLLLTLTGWGWSGQTIFFHHAGPIASSYLSHQACQPLSGHTLRRLRPCEWQNEGSWSPRQPEQ